MPSKIPNALLSSKDSLVPRPLPPTVRVGCRKFDLYCIYGHIRKVIEYRLKIIGSHLWANMICHELDLQRGYTSTST